MEALEPTLVYMLPKKKLEAAAGAADSTLVAAKDSAASDASSAEISDASAAGRVPIGISISFV